MKEKQDLTFSVQNCWEKYTKPAEKKAMQDLAKRYIDFISTCKTERETITYVAERLKKAGFSEDFSKNKVVRAFKGKSIFAAVAGKNPLSSGLRLIGAHADSPRLDLKQHPFLEQAFIGQAKTHYYGGIRKYQWLARPLALHGVIIKENGDTVTVCLGEDPNEPVFTIADLLPHLAQKEVTKTLADAFEGEKLNIIFGHSPQLAEKSTKSKSSDTSKENTIKDPVKTKILTLLHEKYTVKEEDFYSAELQIVPAGPARFVGLDSALIGAYGQDDRICVFTALEALLDAQKHDQPLAVIFWDKEEIGSEGSTGAKSRFMEYCITDLAVQWEPKTQVHTIMLACKAISADVHAAIDPDWQELHEKLNSAHIGHGPCFCKFTGHRGKNDANDAHPEYVAWLRKVMNKADIPWQMAELGKVDSGGGGTVAMYLAMYGMDIIDFGPAVLSMHSPFELASVADLYTTKLAYHAFFTA